MQPVGRAASRSSKVPQIGGFGDREGLTSVSTPHQPEVVYRGDGTWVVECAQCRRDRTSAMPVGIGLVVHSRVVAEMIRDNHRGPRRNAKAG